MSGSIFYICASGEVKKRAEEYRRTYIRLKTELWNVVERLGSDTASIDTTMMHIRGVKFKGDPPAGWTKRDRHGLSWPKRTKENAEILKHFSPGGCYMIQPHPELRPFFEWLGCPVHYAYTTETGSGSSRVGDLWDPVSLCWYSAKSPIALILPDVAAEKKRAEKNGYKVKDKALDWKPPKGLRRILKEEYALMEARHKAATKDTP